MQLSKTNLMRMGSWAQQHRLAQGVLVSHSRGKRDLALPWIAARTELKQGSVQGLGLCALGAASMALEAAGAGEKEGAGAKEGRSGRQQGWSK